jgi:hypothetical protein
MGLASRNFFVFKILTSKLFAVKILPYPSCETRARQGIQQEWGRGYLGHSQDATFCTNGRRAQIYSQQKSTDRHPPATPKSVTSESGSRAAPASGWL